MKNTDLSLAVITPPGVSELDSSMAFDHRRREACAAIADRERNLQLKKEAEARERVAYRYD